MRVILVLSFALPLLAYRTEDSCLKFSQSDLVSSICAKAASSHDLELIANLGKQLANTETHLSCLIGGSIIELKTTKKVYKLKNIGQDEVVLCRYAVENSPDGSDFVPQLFTIYRGKLYDIYGNAADTHERDD
ncbi:unnamed protein product [Hymenolepis diminuta]|uniref:DUF5727 domain-containing protein n=1 Tax=Hymenolepis diminuta TaxID=6216 RepID=A0A564ZCF3_HYMDI|nr:unnamed protein product [Hymenolepis diminuta]